MHFAKEILLDIVTGILFVVFFVTPCYFLGEFYIYLHSLLDLNFLTDCPTSFMGISFFGLLATIILLFITSVFGVIGAAVKGNRRL